MLGALSSCENFQLAQVYDRPCGADADTSSPNAAVFASPHEVDVPAGQKQQIWAEVDSIGCSAIRYSLNKALGTVDANGLYVAPGTVKAGGDTVLLIAQSYAKTSVADTVTIYLHEAVADCEVATVSYSKDIYPIMQNQCLACHSSDQFAERGGGVNLDSFAYVASYAKNGMLLASMNYVGRYKMPRRAAKVDSCSIKKVRLWIEKGALND